MSDIDEIKKRIKDRKRDEHKVLTDYHFSKVYNGMIKCMIVMLTLLCVGAFIKISPHANIIDTYILNDEYYKELLNWGMTHVQNFFDNDSVIVSKEVSYIHVEDNYYTNYSNEVINFSNGRVIYIGNQPIMGSYVIVLLENNVEVTYASLTDVFVELYDTVEAGTLIGTYNKEVMLIFNEGVQEINYETFKEKYN